MPTLDTKSGAEEATLCGGAVTRVMEQANRDQVRTRVRFVDDGCEVMGRMRRLVSARLEIRLDPDDAVAPNCDGHRKCAVAFEVDGQPFCFSSVLLGVDGPVAALRRPAELSTKQRRRFWRARLRESAAVEIARQDDSFRCEADILNLSPAGMACRVAGGGADALCVGDALTVRFALRGDGPWRVRAELRGKTPGSESNHAIVRLQFEAGSMASDLEERLQALAGSAGVSS